MILYFLKGTSGYVKIGRTSNFDKRLSEIRRPQDTDVSVLAVFHGTDDFFIEGERELYSSLAGSRYKGEWYEDSEPVRHLRIVSASVIRRITLGRKAIQIGIGVRVPVLEL